MFYTDDPSSFMHGELCHQLHMTALCVTHSLEDEPASWPDRDTDILHRLIKHKLWIFCYVCSHEDLRNLLHCFNLWNLSKLLHDNLQVKLWFRWIVDMSCGETCFVPFKIILSIIFKLLFFWFIDIGSLLKNFTGTNELVKVKRRKISHPIIYTTVQSLKVCKI